MQIHVVKAGETLLSIAEQYQVTPERIIAVNELPNPEKLVVGQSLAIRIPEIVHKINEGDTLSSIAQTYDVTETQILQNNPMVAITNNLTPGINLIISYQGEESIDTILVNGYAYTFMDRTILRKTLPFLTYLFIFNYGFTPEGELVPAEDEEFLNLAKQFSVAPIMVLAPMTAEGNFSSELAHNLFINDAAEDQLIENIVTTINEKGYRGIDIDFEFVDPEDREEFLSFITKMQNRLSQEGLLTFVALAPKTSGEMTGLLYESHDYPAIGAVADYVLLMTYEWGYKFGPPMATAPLNNVTKVVEYGVSVIDPSKIFLGIPNYAYDWPLPFIKGQTEAETISNQEAINRAALHNVTILFDEAAQSPYYYYTDNNGVRHVVWFDDVRSMNAKMLLIPEYNLVGAGVWQIRFFFPGLWNVVGSQYSVQKV
ncbi:glycosyl hydrolase family 18 protein [Anaerosacchariphilus polymeriproducens]|uniref:LysM peptidoglycan-binding domain-containing protein n=1 Tax=Anaerosacchariphilus polymeriproducens TaxID=1812858 RepID=A0A371AUH2_9FIRM|nr:glycosyl hydrolase family 18 protein [Anaerosacchariphilus polymeriproducens]RDU23189.1 LysM peptidoglycan-binding domain-containing protein [Anaerosacchariphilus polymeriproducens]